MVDIAKELQWNYVNTIAEAGTYGEKGIEAFKEAAKNSGEWCPGVGTSTQGMMG